MTRDLSFEVIYPHSPTAVWQALTDSQAMSEWLMENDFEPRIGHKFQFRTKPGPAFDGIVNCEVLEVDEPRRLSYTWQGGRMPRPTIVTWTLEPVPAGTHVRLEQTGFDGLYGTLAWVILGMGWRKKVLHQSLPQFIDHMQNTEGSFTRTVRRQHG